MSNINFSRKQHFWQNSFSLKLVPLKTLRYYLLRKSLRVSGEGLREGFLCIELLQGLLVLGALLLLVSAFHVLSVHWQHQAIKRFEALDLIATELSFGKSDREVTTHDHTIHVMLRAKEIRELSSLLGKSVVVEQKIVTALWQDERKSQHTLRIVS